MQAQPVPNGFSMVEVLVVVAILMIVSAITVVALQPTLQNFRASDAEGQVKSTLRQAREYAVSQRRTVAVSFATDAFGNPEMKLNLYTVAAGVQVLNNVPFQTVPLEPTVQFALFPALPDTPDKFGNASALCFNGAAYAAGTVIEFQSDGTFTNGAGTPINGSIFMGIPNYPTTARAVTILGATGRIKGWTGADGASWSQQ